MKGSSIRTAFLQGQTSEEANFKIEKSTKAICQKTAKKGDFILEHIQNRRNDKTENGFPEELSP
jgi:hypothetical protein